MPHLKPMKAFRPVVGRGLLPGAWRFPGFAAACQAGLRALRAGLAWYSGPRFPAAGRRPSGARAECGGVAEWLKAHAWKVCIPETVSRVRIPLPPPNFNSPMFASVHFAHCGQRILTAPLPYFVRV